jgi:hypothetical protein
MVLVVGGRGRGGQLVMSNRTAAEIGELFEVELEICGKASRSSA